MQGHAEAREPMWVNSQHTLDVSSTAKQQHSAGTLLGWALVLLDFIFTTYFHPFHFQASPSADSVRPQVISTTLIEN